VNEAAKRLNLTSAGPSAEEVIFIRSDQYSFVKQGVPSVFPVAGSNQTTQGQSRGDLQELEQMRYHQPQDDMNQPGLDFMAAAGYARFVFLCGWTIAQKTERPTWNSGDFFGEHYAKNSR